MCIPSNNPVTNRQTTNINRKIIKSSVCENTKKMPVSNGANKTNYAYISLISRLRMRKYRISYRLFF